jgi:hypothetical protein
VTDLGFDDFSASNTTSGALAVGGTASGNIQFGYDQDWFRIDLVANRIYAFEMKGLDSASGTLPIAYLQLLSGQSAYLTSNMGGGTGNDARLIFSPADNGTYLLAAQGTGDSLGTYTLTATEIGTDDHVGSNLSTSSLAVGNASTGNIQFSGDQDWFRIDLSPGQVVTFDLKGSASGSGTLPEPALRLLDGAGMLLANSGNETTNNDARLIFSPQSEGTYFLAAEAYFESTGTYTLTATLIDNDDHLGSTATTSTLGAGIPVTGDIQFGGDQDWFRLALTAGRIYTIDMKGADSASGTLSDPYLLLLDGSANAQYLAYDNDSGNGSDARLIFSPLIDSNFFLSAQGLFGVEGTYTLTMTDIGADDYLGNTATTGTLVAGNSVSGNIQYQGDQDWFRIELTAGQIYAFDMKGADSAGGTLGAPFLLLLDSTTNFIASNFEGGTGRDALISFSPANSGIYYLQAQGLSDPGGTYTLQATDLGADDYAGNQTTTGMLTMGESLTGNIQFSSDLDWFRIDLVAGHFYVFDMKGVDSGGGTLADPKLQLHDGAAGYLATDFDGGIGADARLNFAAVNSGPYYLSTIGSGGVGTYTLTALDLGVDDFDASISTTGNLAPGGSITGNIQQANESDWFRIELSAGRIYRFELKGADSGGGDLANPYLQLRNDFGSVLASDYDSGIGLDAQLSYLAANSGSYYLATYSNSSEMIGSYTLTATDIGADDHGNDTNTTSGLALNGTVTGDIQFSGDQDWFRIDLTAGNTYIFQTSGRDFRRRHAGGTGIDHHQ